MFIIARGGIWNILVVCTNSFTSMYGFSRGIKTISLCFSMNWENSLYLLTNASPPRTVQINRPYPLLFLCSYMMYEPQSTNHFNPWWYTRELEISGSPKCLAFLVVFDACRTQSDRKYCSYDMALWCCCCLLFYFNIDRQLKIKRLKPFRDTKK